MPQFTGMDIGQVRQLAQLLKAKAGEIDGIRAEVTASVGSTQWVGPDQVIFEQEWNGNCTTQLQNVMRALEEAAANAERNAGEQESASAQ